MDNPINTAVMRTMIRGAKIKFCLGRVRPCNNVDGTRKLWVECATTYYGPKNPWLWFNIPSGSTKVISLAESVRIQEGGSAS